MHQKAFEVGLGLRSIPYEILPVVPLCCEAFSIGEGWPDLDVGPNREKVTIELKVLEGVRHKESAQIDNYLPVVQIPHGLLINLRHPAKAKSFPGHD